MTTPKSSVFSFIKNKFPEKSIRDLRYLSGKPSEHIKDISQRHPDWVLLKEGADECDIVYQGSWHVIPNKQLHEIEKTLGGLTPSDFDMQALLIEFFPDKKVMDVTDRVNADNLGSFIRLADRQHDLFVLIRRTLQTDSLFRSGENPGDFWIFHKDDYVFTNRDAVGDDFKRLLTKIVRGEQDLDCMICHDNLDYVREHLKSTCSTCGSKICHDCLRDLMFHGGEKFKRSIHHVKCPVCQNETAFKGRLQARARDV